MKIFGLFSSRIHNTNTHKKKICIYIYLQKEKKGEKYKPGYETREIINVSPVFILRLLMSLNIRC
jgi:hypothetical protein